MDPLLPHAETGRKDQNTHPTLTVVRKDGQREIFFQETSDFTQNLCSRLKDIDAVADEMVSKVENMKKEMISRKEVQKQRHQVG